MKINFDSPSYYVNQTIEISGYAEMTEETRWEDVKFVLMNSRTWTEKVLSLRSSGMFIKPTATILRKKVENSPDHLKTGAKLAAGVK